MGVGLVWRCWVMLVTAAVAGATVKGETGKESAERPRRSALADPTPVSTTDLAALGGLGGLSGLTGVNGAAAGASGAANVCGNQDLLTNLLVYQFLSGNVPGGASGANPQLAALLGSQGPATRTVTTVSKTQTLLSVDVPATTHFSTSTTSYVTTITSVETKIIPVIFRGSRITTTITESSEEVITATEYFTESSVHQPSIVQTLPVHITITETRTRGLDGVYTLFDLTHGATSVIQEPINTPTFDLDSTGLDLSNLDLSQLDLTSLTGGGLPSLDGDQGQVLAMLSSLLAGTDDTAGDLPRPAAGGNRNFRHQRNRNKNQKGSRFSPDYADYEDTVDETPKYNVLRGFTLSDRVASVSAAPPSTGRAATDTRYSKYHRKTRPDNNGISTTESSPREAERFSASTRRRTLSRTDRRRSTAPRSAPSTRFVAAPETQYFEEDPSKFRPFGQRQNREIANRRRGSLESRPSHPSAPRARSVPRLQARQVNAITTSSTSTPQPTGLSTVLTMYISGSEPGQFSTRLRTIQLRSLGSSRKRRNVNELPMTKLSTSSVLPPPSLSTAIPQIPPEADPGKVVQMLKQLEPTHVRQMLHSLQKWVDFYSHEVLDELDNRVVPQLTSSLSVEIQEPQKGATTALPRSPAMLTGLSLATDRCPVPSTVTTTVYRTVILTAGINTGEANV